MSIFSNRSGMALLLALFVVTFMTAVTVQMIVSVNWQLLASFNQSDGARLDTMVQSGLSLGRAALYADQLDNEFDSPHDEWATLDPETHSALFGGNRLEVRVVDLSGRLPVNGLVATEDKGGAGNSQGSDGNEDDNDATDAGNGNQGEDTGGKEDSISDKYREIWKRFLTSGRFAVESDSEADELLAALADWIDEDDEERDNGAENSHYQSQDPPYACANAPFTHPEQLLLVRGVSRELLYGDGEREGIIDYITVTSGDEVRININSAPAPVLLALSQDFSEETVEDLIEFRENEANRESLSSIAWYMEVSQEAVDDKVCDVVGEYFQISVDAEYNGLAKSGAGLIQRHGNKEQTLLYWKVE